MPVIIPQALPAYTVLTGEGRACLPLESTPTGDTLQIAILNLMPKKISTEAQLLRQLSYSGISIAVTLLRPSGHISKNTPQEHLDTFYTIHSQVEDRHFDGLIITGAPIEQMSFEEVDYWSELCRIMDWSQTHCSSTFHICWGAQAALYYRYGVRKLPLPQKMFGVFAHTADLPNHPLLDGFPAHFYAPHSRHTTLMDRDILSQPGLEVLSSSQQAGIYLVADQKNNIFVTGHSEYDDDTLAQEYFRDKDKGLPIEVPENYFIGDDPSAGVRNLWSDSARQLYTNWVRLCARS